MLKSIIMASTVAAALLATSAQAIIFPVGTAQTRKFDLKQILNDVNVEIFNETFVKTGEILVGLEGTVTLGPRVVPDPPGDPEPVLGPPTQLEAFITSPDFLDYFLEVPFAYDADGSTQKITFTPANSTLEVLAPVLKTDGQSISVDFSDQTLSLGQGLINLVLDVDLNSTADDIAFPNGRRFGDDVNDLILVSILKGSINLGTAFVDGFPRVITQGPVDPSNTLEIATLQTAAVPVPPALGLLAGALGLLGLSRLRRSA